MVITCVTVQEEKVIAYSFLSSHLIVPKMVQVVLPATHDMQLEVVPPQTTSLPPERRERLW